MGQTSCILLYLRLIKNVHHRQSIAKLRSGNHGFKKFETGRHCVPKIPENLRICPYCSSSEEENEILSVFHCHLHKQIRKTFLNDITLKYPAFNTLSKQNKTLFLFSNIDPFICKKKKKNEVILFWRPFRRVNKHQNR